MEWCYTKGGYAVVDCNRAAKEMVAWAMATKVAKAGGSKGSGIGARDG